MNGSDHCPCCGCEEYESYCENVCDHGAEAPDHDDYEAEAADGCPSCGGAVFALGRLGRLQWWRCRDCGHDINERTAS